MNNNNTPTRKTFSEIGAPKTFSKTPMIPFLPGERDVIERMTSDEWLATKLRFMGFQVEHPDQSSAGTLERHDWSRHETSWLSGKPVGSP